MGAFSPLRATDLAFAIGPDRNMVSVGAPWLDARKAASALSDRLIPGVEFRAGRERLVAANSGAPSAMPAIRIELTDRDRGSGQRIAAAILSTIHKLHPDSLKLDPPGMRRITGGFGFGEAILAGEDSDAIVDRDLVNIIGFQRRVRAFQLYR
jgi:uncharacterized protein YbbC (DUF1343 family)